MLHKHIFKQLCSNRLENRYFFMYIPITSGVLAVCKCSVFRCNCNEGKANITSRVCECSCSLPDVADVLLPRGALLPSDVLSTLSLSTHGNLSTAIK